jgi:glycosyltransferase involved in cell wall biosynthesis
MVKISVIIPTFNSEKHIARTIRSVLNQEGAGREFELELIVIDDCSTDSTADILAQFDIDFYFRASKNSGGPNGGRNVGLKNATGDYICMLDHDDLWMPQKVRLQLQAAERFPIVTSGFEVADSHTGCYRIASHADAGIKVFNTNETFLKKLSKSKGIIQNTYMSTVMFHKSLKDILFEEHFGMLDFDWVLRLFENRTSAEVCVNLVTRFVEPRNLSLNEAYRMRDYYYALMCLEGYEHKYPAAVAKGIKRINGSRARYYYLVGEMPKARRYFLKSMPGLKEGFYYVTSFLGNKWVKSRFVVFG